LNAADFYDLNREHLLKLERFAAKSADNLINSIEASKKVPFERVLYAIGIRFVGETVARKLAIHFKSMDALMNADNNELLEVGEIGEVIAGSVISFFSIEANRRMIQRMKAAGIQMSSNSAILRQSEKLSGKNFVISGVFKNHTREEMQHLIEENGGKNLSSVSTNTNFIIAGEGMGPAKKEKAMKLGIPILSEAEFMEMLEA
jgi:DNA ligase (NAD+)